MLNELRNKRILVIGLGVSGLSVVRFLCAQGIAFDVADSRDNPPGLDELRELAPGAELLSGDFNPARFAEYQVLVKNPGIDPREPAVVAAVAAGAELIGDVELFARVVKAPVIAVTGSNGKSTVVSMLGEMGRAAGRRTAVCGNIGQPVLDALGENAELYVVELSSFQLETTDSLKPAAATILNLSEDHLDRYDGMAGYLAAKQRIYRDAAVCLFNAADVPTRPATCGGELVSFGVGGDWSLQSRDGADWLFAGDEPLMALSELRVPGRHNGENALAALALGEAVGLPRAAMLDGLRAFSGLPQRCEWLGERDDVRWYNDSKGTNVGSTLAALAGMPEPVVLIAGGEGKDQDFTPLKPALADSARALVLIGRDAALIEAAVAGACPIVHAATLSEAVDRAAELAQPGDAVLLSPACASFDMFRNYFARGEAFAAEVGRLLS